MQIGALDGRDELLVLDAFLRLDLGHRVGARAGVLPEGLVADDRGQPLLAAARIAQRRATSPRSQQRILGDVLRFAGIARVAVGEADAEPLRLLPLPAVFARFPCGRKFD